MEEMNNEEIWAVFDGILDGDIPIETLDKRYGMAFMLYQQSFWVKDLAERVQDLEIFKEEILRSRNDGK